MAVNPREKLRCALITMARNGAAEDLVSPAMTVLEPLFQIADSGCYGETSHPITAEQVAQTIDTSLETGVSLPVLMIRPDSTDVEVILSRPNWFPAFLHGALAEDIQKLLNKGLNDLFNHGFHQNFMTAFSYVGHHKESDFTFRLERHIADTFGRSLEAALESSLTCGLLKGLSTQIWLSCGKIISYYLYSLAVGLEPAFVRLEPLVKLLPSCVPFAVRDGDGRFYACVDFSPNQAEDPLYPKGRKPHGLLTSSGKV